MAKYSEFFRNDLPVGYVEKIEHVDARPDTVLRQPATATGFEFTLEVMQRGILVEVCVCCNGFVNVKRNVHGYFAAPQAGTWSWSQAKILQALGLEYVDPGAPNSTWRKLV